MEYTTLGKTDLRVSILGFGCMRLPMAEGRVDRELSTPMLRRAYDLGVNFFDTAIGYCGRDSQRALGEAVEPFREEVLISTKNHLHDAEPAEWREALEDSLRFLRTDYLDIYNFHGIGWALFQEKLDPDKGGLLKEMLRAHEEGLVRHVGFSFHDKPEALVKIAATGYFESVILQYNLLDQANAEAMHEVAEMGLGIIVMGPVGGGRLGIPSDKIIELTGGKVKSTVEAALRFVWAHPAVNIALSGMGDMNMLEQNAQLAEETQAFTPEEIEGINALVKERLEKSGLYCTNCGYCLETCPAGVQIPQNLELLNMARIYGLTEPARGRYKRLRKQAILCVACGKCIEKCPQGIDIPARLRDTVLALDKNAGKVTLARRMDKITPDGQLAMTLTARNLSEDARDVEMELSSDDGASFDPAQISLPGLEPFKRVHESVTGTFPAEVRRVVMSVQVSHEGTCETHEMPYEFTIINKGLTPDWSAGEWQEIAPPEDEFAAQHGARFNLSYDEGGLLLLADVQDDFLCPSTPESKGSPCDCVELFLDGRAPADIGKRGYADGVYQVFLYPGTPGQAEAFADSKKEINPQVSAERTPEGYRLRAYVPFCEFCVEEGVPAKLGFEITVNTATAEGERLCQYGLSGSKNSWRNPSVFREVWLL